MDKHVPAIDITNLKYIEFHASGMDATFEITSRWLDKFDEATQRQQWAVFADRLWDQSLSVFPLMCGFNTDLIHPSRWRMSRSGNRLTRRFNTPAWGTPPFKSFSAIIHLRDSFISERSIDTDFIDLFLTFSSDPYASTYAPIEDDESVFFFLCDIMPQLTAILTDVAQIITGDDMIQVKTLAPVWEEECVVESGADGYWIRGILTSDTL